MRSEEIKLKTKELLKASGNMYFPGIWLILIPALLFSIPMDNMFKGGFSYFITGIICTLIVSYFFSWFTLWSVNVVVKGGTIRESIPSLKIFISFAIIMIINQCINLVLLNKWMEHSLGAGAVGISIIVSFITLIISWLFCILMTSTVMCSIKNQGKLEPGKISRLFCYSLIRFFGLTVSYIPLLVLICMTFGILLFWKITYIQTSYSVLINDIYEKSMMDNYKVAF